ncbi:MAG: hypothetical protein ACYS8W_19235 [Planctomycetota bacterium]|jgi:hypothetical protein
MNNASEKKTYGEPLLTGRFVAFFVIYMTSLVIAAIIVFPVGARGPELIPLGLSYGIISSVRLAFALFGRMGYGASPRFLYETFLLTAAGFPAGYIAASAGGISLAGMTGVELLIAGAFLLSGSVAALAERMEWRADVFYVAAAAAFCFGAPLLWFQLAHYAGVRWDFFAALSPFYHCFADIHSGGTIFYAVLILFLGTSIIFFKKSKSPATASETAGEESE